MIDDDHHDCQYYGMQRTHFICCRTVSTIWISCFSALFNWFEWGPVCARTRYAGWTTKCLFTFLLELIVRVWSPLNIADNMQLKTVDYCYKLNIWRFPHAPSVGFGGDNHFFFCSFVDVVWLFLGDLTDAKQQNPFVTAKLDMLKICCDTLDAKHIFRFMAFEWINTKRFVIESNRA